MSIDWGRLKKRLAKIPTDRHPAVMADAWVQCRGRFADARTPAEVADYLGVSVDLVELALASDRVHVNNE